MASPSTNALQAAIKSRQQTESTEDKPEAAVSDEQASKDLQETAGQELMTKDSKKYLMNTAPCTVRVPDEGRMACPDGTLTTSNPKIIEFMDKKVAQRLCKDITDEVKVDRTKEQRVPSPTGKIFDDQQ